MGVRILKAGTYNPILLAIPADRLLSSVPPKARREAMPIVSRWSMTWTNPDDIKRSSKTSGNYMELSD